MDRRHARALGLVVAVKIVVSIVAWRAGFRAVSDDDFARVAIAQAFAHAPKLDPSGTSWLPLPFWFYGSVMRALGASIDVARGTALGLGLLSAALVYGAASLATTTRLGALLGACAAAAFLWSARLGVATVPELPTAALTLLALVTLMPRAVERWPHARLVGAGALVLATLSRYEPWFVAAFFVAICVVDAARASTPRRRGAQLLAAALAALGPLLWMAWNRVAHGDALHFVARVVAYKRALGADELGTAFAALAAPLAILRDEPELTAGLFAALIVLVALGRARALSAYARPAGAASLLMAGLAIAAMRDGAPTHHPERALLVVMLLMAVIAGDAVALLGACRRKLRQAPSLTLQGAARAAPPQKNVVFWGPLPTRGLLRRPILMCRALPDILLCSRASSVASPMRLGFGIMALAFMALAAQQRIRAPRSTLADREGALALGVEAARRLTPGERLLVAIDDDGSWATIAGFGRPHDLVRDRDLDPRRPLVSSSFAQVDALRTKLEQTGARAFVGRASEALVDAFGAPVVGRDGQGLWLVR